MRPKKIITEWNRKFSLRETSNISTNMFAWCMESLGCSIVVKLGIRGCGVPLPIDSAGNLLRWELG